MLMWPNTEASCRLPRSARCATAPSTCVSECVVCVSVCVCVCVCVCGVHMDDELIEIGRVESVGSKSVYIVQHEHVRACIAAEA